MAERGARPGAGGPDQSTFFAFTADCFPRGAVTVPRLVLCGGAT
ncbi:hypothetical protein ATKI12_5060 [Kitasatospora sp. Ki12]